MLPSFTALFVVPPVSQVGTVERFPKTSGSTILRPIGGRKSSGLKFPEFTMESIIGHVRTAFLPFLVGVSLLMGLLCLGCSTTTSTSPSLPKMTAVSNAILAVESDILAGKILK